MSRGSLVYYIDGHGFGHATRSLAVLRELVALRPELECLVRTSAPSFLFEHERLGGVRVLPGPVGPGTVQADPLTLDVEASVEARQRFQDQLPHLVEQEISTLQPDDVALVAGDIPPLAFEVASRLGVPSVGLGNFSWDWIYEPFLEGRPGGDALLAAMRDSYGRADLMLRMPLHGSMDAFRHVEDIPHVVRPAGETDLRRRLGLEDEKRALVLLSFGGFGGLTYRPGTSLGQDLGDFRFLVPGDGPAGLPDDTIRLAVDHPFPHQDLVALCDVVISKPGYGTVTECLARRTPMLYTSRENFREYPVLVEGLRQGARSRFLPREELLSLRWREPLEALLSDEGPWPPVRTDGAVVAAKRILALLGGA